MSPADDIPAECHPQIEYVLVLAFSENRRNVVVLRKAKPAWMAGKLNFPGGKIEPNESPRAAALREFEEETGIALEPTGIEAFAVLHGDYSERRGYAFRMTCFVAFTDGIYGAKTPAGSNEPVCCIPLANLAEQTTEDRLENVVWLAHLAISDHRPDIVSATYLD
jgi:mutator protein MutT